MAPKPISRHGPLSSIRDIERNLDAFMHDYNIHVHDAEPGTAIGVPGPQGPPGPAGSTLGINLDGGIANSVYGGISSLNAGTA